LLFFPGSDGPLQRRLQQLLLYMRCLQLLSQVISGPFSFYVESRAR
jgi:hypothetical protein